MAKTGLTGIRYAVLDTDDGTYGTPASLGKGVKVSVSPKSADAKLYADDALAESDSSFIEATVSAEVDDAREATVLAPLLGHTVATGLVTSNADDVAPYVGMGRIVTLVRDNVKAYKAVFLTKVKFNEPNEEDATKADNVTFNTTTLEGVASQDANGDWRKAKEFPTKAEAVEFIDTCFGVEA